MSERRCPSCGALVAADAEWCGQCLASLREAAPPGSSGPPATSVRAPFGDERDGPPSVWRCPTCDAENGLDANTCRICGTSFGRLFEGPATTPTATPGAAAAWSLLLPGLGHWLAGRRAEAVARFVLAAWILAMLVVLLSSRVGGAGLGGAAPLILVFGVAAVALWAEAAVDGRRAAAGLAPIVSSRALLWGCVALVALSIVLSTLLAVPGLQSGAAK
jgi:ribosomal protein L40E